MGPRIQKACWIDCDRSTNFMWSIFTWIFRIYVWSYMNMCMALIFSMFLIRHLCLGGIWQDLFLWANTIKHMLIWDWTMCYEIHMLTILGSSIKQFKWPPIWLSYLNNFGGNNVKPFDFHHGQSLLRGIDYTQMCN